MTPVTPPGAGVSTPMPIDTGERLLASQNLFEHAASQAGAGHAGTSPSQLGSDLMNNLDGFIERSREFSHEANLTEPPAERGTLSLEATPETPSAFDDTQLSSAIDSLSRVFDHSIETSMVVRGATQVSGSANTLLRGQ